MGINVGLCDESGAIVGEEIFDEQNLLAHLITSTPLSESTHCIQYVDAYGDTVFNRLQMTRFLNEWKSVEAQAISSEQKKVATAVAQLARQCNEGVHLYLKFIGD